MMRPRSMIMTAVSAAILFAGSGWASQARAPQPAALARLAPGAWLLRDADDGSQRELCVRDGRELLQLQHEGIVCSRFVIEDLPARATVHYTCPAAGHGRTSVSVVTPRSARIETQGIAGGLPFERSFEARRTGECPRR